MGRIIMYAAIAVLAIFVLAVTLLVEAGGDSTATVSTISINQVLTSPDDWANQEFTTRGILEYDEPSDTYSVSESGEAIRIAFEPAEIAEFVGQEVRVTGRVAFDEEGVYIEADRVRPVEL